MAETRKKRPRDPVQLAKLVGDIATGQVADREGDEKDEALAERKRRGGVQGGAARAVKLTSAERSEIARLGAEARWKKSGD